MTAEQARLFIALWPTGAVRRSIAAYGAACQWQGRPARVRDDKLHITLHFLGNVERSRLSELRSALALPSAAFDLVLGRPALWSRGVAVIEPLDVPDGLRALFTALQEALHGLGLPVESRPFRPHITLARHVRRVDFSEEALHVIWRVEAYALLESRIETGEYRVLARYPLLSGA